MDKQELRAKALLKLCYYDKRNPDCAGDEEIEDRLALTIKGKRAGIGVLVCYCDNCFYGRSELANDILNLLDAA